MNSAMSRGWSVLQVKVTKRRRFWSSYGDHCANEGIPRTDGDGSVNFSVTYFCWTCPVGEVGVRLVRITEVDFERRFRGCDFGVDGRSEGSKTCDVGRRFWEGVEMLEMVSIPLESDVNGESLSDGATQLESPTDL